MLDRKIIDDLHELNKKLQGISFSLAMREEDDTISIHRRDNQPCYGELRTYGKGSVPEEREKDPRPGDLHHRFPKGTPEAVGIRLFYQSHIKDLWNKFVEFIFSGDSPWGPVFENRVEFTKNQSGLIIGIVMIDTEFDPTAFVNCLKFIRSIGDNKLRQWNNLQLKHKFSPMDAFIGALIHAHDYVNDTIGLYKSAPGLLGDINIKRMMEKNPINLSGNLTFRQRSAYNRPKVEYVFSDEKNNIKNNKNYGKVISIKEFEEHIKSL